MEYNSYYPAQPNMGGHPQLQSGPPPPPPPSMAPNNQHGCSPIQMMQPGQSPMMHGSPAPPPMRQVITPGPPSMGHHQQQQQQPPPPPGSMMGGGVGPPHHMGPGHQQQQQPPPPPPSHHQPNYHQLPLQPSSLPLSGSPHLNQQQPSRPSTGPSPLHQQSPLHMSMGGGVVNGGGPMPPMHQQGPPHMMGGGPPPPMPPNHLQPHQQNSFINSGPPPPQPPPPSMMSHGGYSQPNQLQSPLPPHQHAPLQPPPLLPHHPLPPPNMHQPNGPHGPPGPGYLPHPHHPHPHHHHPHPLDRGSPFYQNIPQAELRILELNKRLQNRPRPRGPPSPIPYIGASEEGYWWERFASDFFDDDSTLSLRIPAEDKHLEYTIGRTLIPRFFRSFFEDGVLDLSVKLRNTRELQHPHMIVLDCDQADIVTKNIIRHPQASNMFIVVLTEGHLNLEFVSNNIDNLLLIKSWRFTAYQYHEYIDRTMSVANHLFQEPITKFGLTKKTIAYLKMCMIMEPMQELMNHHKKTGSAPRLCLKQLLFDKYKVKSVEDNRSQPTRRRKRKTPAAATGVTKKSKASANNNTQTVISNNTNNNSIGFNSNLISPSTVGSGSGSGGVPNLSLASQDVMVVGEPSMLSTDFGDENERRITRLENNQFDPTLNSNTSSNSNSGNNSLIQNQNQMSNTNQQTQPNNMNHLQQPQQQQPQLQNNHESGNGEIQMMNNTNNSGANSTITTISLPNSNNNSSSNNNNNNSNTSDLNEANNGVNCLQQNNSSNNNNNHQMDLIAMNGTTNHMNHIVKSEMELKQPNDPLPTPVDSEAI